MKFDFADMEDFIEMDAALKNLTQEERDVIAAVYLHFPYQSIFFVSAELKMPPTYINRHLERAKVKLGR